MQTTDLILIILLTVITLLLIFTSIIACIALKHVKSYHETVNINLYHLIKNLKMHSNSLTTITDTLSQLSESFSKPHTTTNMESNLLPTPELEEQITATIKDQIATEVVLSADLRSPYKDGLRDIILRTVETYPNISVEYIARKVISMIEIYSK